MSEDEDTEPNAPVPPTPCAFRWAEAPRATDASSTLVVRRHRCCRGADRAHADARPRQYACSSCSRTGQIVQTANSSRRSSSMALVVACRWATRGWSRLGDGARATGREAQRDERDRSHRATSVPASAEGVEAGVVEMLPPAALEFDATATGTVIAVDGRALGRGGVAMNDEGARRTRRRVDVHGSVCAVAVALQPTRPRAARRRRLWWFCTAQVGVSKRVAL